MNQITILNDHEIKTVAELGLISNKDLAKYDLTYVEEGSNCYNYRVAIHSEPKLQSIIIPELMRCIGICMHLIPKSSDVDDSAGMIGFHISPVMPTAKLRRHIQRKYFWLLKNLSAAYNIPAIYIAGGRINTEVNRSHYDISIRSFVKPLAYILPEVPLYQFATFENTQSTMLAISKNKVSALRVGNDGKYQLSHIDLQSYVNK